MTNVARTSELSKFTEEDFVALSRHKLNGRQVRYSPSCVCFCDGAANKEQIKNIVSCAVSLAREENKHIAIQDIEALMEILVN